MAALGIISDTHGNLPLSVYEAFKDVDYIIHAGDIGSHLLLWELETIAPTFAVLGNNDWESYGCAATKERKISLGGCRIYIIHYPKEAKAAAKSGNYDLVVFGHTHVPHDEMIGTCRLLNPGSTTRPRHGSKKSVMTIEVKSGTVGPSMLHELA